MAQRESIDDFLTNHPISGLCNRMGEAEDSVRIAETMQGGQRPVGAANGTSVRQWCSLTSRIAYTP